MGIKKVKVGFIGGVNSSFCTLKKLVEYEFDIVCVLGYKPSEKMVVSGYNDFELFCMEKNISFTPFTRINEHAELIKELNLDVLFVVGISQLISKEIIDTPRLGCIGYHPTLLPKGRGRAPVAWIVHELENGAANFFLITDEADAGPIFIQEPFEVEERDDAGSVEGKILQATDKALDKWLPDLKLGNWNPVAQDDKFATEYGVRKPEDGLIDWEKNSNSIVRLIRTSAPPHPSAYTYLGLNKLIINKVELDLCLNIKGCVGRVLKITGNVLIVQAGNGVIKLTDWTIEGDPPKVGNRLGYLVQEEIYLLKLEINEIKQKLGMI
jgi:methionyl-tRNA formyltransferase